MPAIAIVIISFLGGLFTMSVINLYKYVIQIMNKGL
jgi:hypothetical protein